MTLESAKSIADAAVATAIESLEESGLPEDRIRGEIFCMVNARLKAKKREREGR